MVEEKLGRSQTFGSVKTETEKNLFGTIGINFKITMERKPTTTVYSSIAFGAFAAFRDKVISEEEDGNQTKMDMALKTAFHLQYY